jgi:hypothetical protein
MISTISDVAMLVEYHTDVEEHPAAEFLAYELHAQIE